MTNYPIKTEPGPPSPQEPPTLGPRTFTVGPGGRPVSNEFIAGQEIKKSRKKIIDLTNKKPSAKGIDKIKVTKGKYPEKEMKQLTGKPIITPLPSRSVTIGNEKIIYPALQSTEEAFISGINTPAKDVPNLIKLQEELTKRVDDKSLNYEQRMQLSMEAQLQRERLIAATGNYYITDDKTGKLISLKMPENVAEKIKKVTGKTPEQIKTQRFEEKRRIKPPEPSGAKIEKGLIGTEESKLKPSKAPEGEYKEVKPKAQRYKKIKEPKTVGDIVVNRRGIKPQSLREHGINPKEDRALWMRYANKEGREADDLAQSMIAEGELPEPPRNYNPSDWLFKNIRENTSLPESMLPRKKVKPETEYKAGEISPEVGFEKPAEYKPEMEEAVIQESKKYKNADEFVGYTDKKGRIFIGLSKETLRTSAPWRFEYKTPEGKIYAGHETSQKKALEAIQKKFVNPPTQPVKEVKPKKKLTPEEEFFIEQRKKGLTPKTQKSGKSKEELREELRKKAESGELEEDIFYQAKKKKQLKLFEKQAGYKAPTFYSQLKLTINTKMSNRMKPNDLRNMLEKAPGVKPDEMKWTGLDDYLKEKAANKEWVTKEEVQKFLNENRVKIKEIVKGGKPMTARQLAERSGENWDNLGPNERQRYEDEIAKSGGSPGTKFSEFQMAGEKRNYRELLLTLPGKSSFTKYRGFLESKYGLRGSELEEKITHEEFKNLTELASTQQPVSPRFRSPHFEEPNVLAHVRFNERKGPNGERILFIEEVQSDWHQKGRQIGYSGEQDIPKVQDVTDTQIKVHGEWFNAKRLFGKPASEFKVGDSVPQLVDQALGVPNAPFKKTWPDLAMKRMLRWAAENDFDRIAWTTGEQQAKRYDLSKYIGTLDAIKRANGTYDIIAAGKHGEGLIFEKNSIKPDELENYVGKDLSKKIIEGKGKKISENQQSFSGLDLKVGGEGMKGFYDKILPNTMKKLGKKWGVVPGTINIESSTSELKLEVAKRSGKEIPTVTVHSLPITEQMKRSVITEGQALFEPRKDLDYGKTIKISGQEYSAPKTITPKATYSPLREKQTAYIEKKYTKYKQIQFTGGQDPVKSPQDVAFIFDSLKGQSVEHVFALHVLPNDRVIIQHISTGDLHSSIVDAPSVTDLADRMNTEELWFVHNHPSGNIEPSKEDIQIIKGLSESLKQIKKGGKSVYLQGSVIIDSEKFGFIAKDGSYTPIPFDKTKTAQKILNAVGSGKIKNFGTELFKVGGPEDAVKFFEAITNSEVPQIGVMFLNMRNQISGLDYLDAEHTLTEISKHIQRNAAKRLSNSVILISSGEGVLTPGKLALVQSDLLNIKVLDNINFTEPGKYVSFREGGLLQEPNAQKVYVKELRDELKSERVIDKKEAQSDETPEEIANKQDQPFSEGFQISRAKEAFGIRQEQFIQWTGSEERGKQIFHAMRRADIEKNIMVKAVKEDMRKRMAIFPKDIREEIGEVVKGIRGKDENGNLLFGSLQRAGIIKVKDAEGINTGDRLEDGRIAGPPVKIDNKDYIQLYRIIKPEEAEQRYNDLIKRNPRAKDAINSYIDPYELPRITEMGLRKPPFSRVKMKEVYNVESGMEEEGVSYVGSIPKDPKLFPVARRITRNFISAFSRRHSPHRLYQTGSMREKGMDEKDLFKIQSKTGLSFAMEDIHNRMVGQVLNAALIPLKPGEELLPGYVSFNMGYFKDATTQQRMLRMVDQMRDLFESNELDVNAIKSTIYQAGGGKYQVSEKLIDFLTKNMKSQKEGLLKAADEFFGTAIRTITAFWLMRPSTINRNIISNETFMAVKTIEDFHKGWLDLIVNMQKPAPFANFLSDILAQIPTPINPAKRFLPKKVITDIKLGKSIFSGLEKDESPGLRKAFFHLWNMSEFFTKRRIAWADYRSMAIRDYLKIQKEGKSLYPDLDPNILQLAREGKKAAFIDSFMKNIPEEPEIKGYGSVDRWMFDYDNIPDIMAKMRKSTVGKGILPYPVFFYKLYRQMATIYGPRNIVYAHKAWQRGDKDAFTSYLAKILTAATITFGLYNYMDYLKDDKERIQGKYAPWYTDTFGRIPVKYRNRTYWVRLYDIPYIGESMFMESWITGDKELYSYFLERISLGPIWNIAQTFTGGGTKYDFLYDWGQFKPLGSRVGQTLAGFAPPVMQYIRTQLDPYKRLDYNVYKGFLINLWMGYASRMPYISRWTPEKTSAGESQKYDESEHYKFWMLNVKNPDVEDYTKSLWYLNEVIRKNVQRDLKKGKITQEEYDKEVKLINEMNDKLQNNLNKIQEPINIEKMDLK